MVNYKPNLMYAFILELLDHAKLKLNIMESQHTN